MEDITKKKRFITIFTLILVAVLAGLIFEQMSTTYLVLVDGKTRVRIPRMIVLLKDCDAYKEWFESRFTPLSASTDRCPWTKPPKGNVGEFIINGEVFHIPRDYLGFDKRIPDGVREAGLTLAAVYPDMRPASGNREERHDEIDISIDSSKGWENCQVQRYCDACKFKDHCGPSQYEYEHLSWLGRLSDDEMKIYPIKKEDFPELGLTRYEAKNRLKEYYLRGDPQKPSYWLACDGGEENANYSPGCESHFDYSKRIRVEYSFRQTPHLKDHEEIRDKVIKKLREWQQ